MRSTGYGGVGIASGGYSEAVRTDLLVQQWYKDIVRGGTCWRELEEVDLFDKRMHDAGIRLSLKGDMLYAASRGDNK